MMGLANDVARVRPPTGTPGVSGDVVLERYSISRRFAIADYRGAEIVVYDLGQPSHFVRVPSIVRVLLACFQLGPSVVASEAAAKFVTLLGAERSAELLDATMEMIRRLAMLGILVAPGETLSVYNASMLPAYVVERPVPPEVCDVVVRHAPVRPETAILDLGSGPGNLTVPLAAVSKHVTAMDTSAEFIAAAERRLLRAGLKAETTVGCANRLMFSTKRFDVIVACQCLHWFNPYLAFSGISSTLRPRGTVFAIESKASLPARHPLRRLCGYGKRTVEEILRLSEEHVARYSQWLNMTSDGRLSLMRVHAFRQTRPFGRDFARAYLLEGPARDRRGVAQSWDDIEDVYATAPAETRGTMIWWVAQFGESPHSNTRPECSIPRPVEIPFTPGRPEVEVQEEAHT